MSQSQKTHKGEMFIPTIAVEATNWIKLQKYKKKCKNVKYTKM